MSDRLMPVAICYDFDGTLAPGNMQEHAFLPKLGITPNEFWTKSNDLAREQQGDRILTYMHLMLKEADHANISMRKEDWAEYGKGIHLFPGTEGWFPRISEEGRQRGLDIEHYIISSGMREMIAGTPVQRYLKAVFASGFLYNASGVAIAPAMAVNYTTKTQYLFRINKGVLDLSVDAAVNAYVAPDDRRVPFSNMIFIGDGDTDIPCFRLVKEQGGHSIAVFPAGDAAKAERVGRLIQERRVHCAAPADYNAGSDLDRRVLAVFDLIAARATITAPHPDVPVVPAK